VVGGLTGGLAALARRQGVVLFLPAIYESWVRHDRSVWRVASRWRSGQILLLIPAGYGVWL